MAIIKKDLFDTNTSSYVLSCLMHNPLLIHNEKFAFVKTDFYKPLHQMIFYAIFNMAEQGVEKVAPQDIDLYIKQYEAQYSYYKENKGYEFVTQCYQIAEGTDERQFEFYYNRLKKFSVLRDLEAAGIDTSEFYDTTKDALNRDLEDEKLNKTSLQTLTNRIREKLVKIDDIHIGKDEGGSQIASKGLRSLVEEYRQNPEVGLPLDGEIINYATRGARLGKLYTYSAPSGGGKTRFMVGNACAISMPYIDDIGQVVFRGTKEENNYQKILFVTSEQQADEIQTLILAYVSGVNEKKILLGNYDPQEWDKVTKALDIIDKYGSNFIIETIPDPSISLAKARLTKYIVQDQVQYIFYDYIFSSPGLLGEFRDIEVREDVALMMLSNTLKEIAANNDVHITSATQLNDGWTKKVVGERDQNCIRGSKAIADKIDCGMIGIRLEEEEKKQIETLWQTLKAQNPRGYKHEPNVVVDMYKNRRGELAHVKIFRYFDYGTCRTEDLFVTDTHYQAVKDIGTLKYDKRAYDFLDLKTGGQL